LENTKKTVFGRGALRGFAADFAGPIVPSASDGRRPCAVWRRSCVEPAWITGLKGSALKTLNNFEGPARVRRILPALSAGVRSVCRVVG
jgi:hypothetical protein